MTKHFDFVSLSMTLNNQMAITVYIIFWNLEASPNVTHYI